jgi:hypothetical protein
MDGVLEEFLRILGSRLLTFGGACACGRSGRTATPTAIQQARAEVDAPLEAAGDAPQS